ncbi:hypothetical protein, partial [Clostridium sp.]|uniref:hypothetical protein n=1 Tax=Clostridium sp. TaxID=1506 RepID=UPI0025B9D2C1
MRAKVSLANLVLRSNKVDLHKSSPLKRHRDKNISGVILLSLFMNFVFNAIFLMLTLVYNS